eukprot:scaffold16995_cov127-Isochrysis_galbana.AAC.11
MIAPGACPQSPTRTASDCMPQASLLQLLLKCLRSASDDVSLEHLRRVNVNEKGCRERTVGHDKHDADEPARLPIQNGEANENNRHQENTSLKGLEVEGKRCIEKPSREHQHRHAKQSNLGGGREGAVRADHTTLPSSDVRSEGSGQLVRGRASCAGVARRSGGSHLDG